MKTKEEIEKLAIQNGYSNDFHIDVFEAGYNEAIRDKVSYATQKVQEERERIEKWVREQEVIISTMDRFPLHKIGKDSILAELQEFLSQHPEAEKVQEDIKDCTNCEYLEKPLNKNPCLICIGFDKWEVLSTELKD